MSPRPLVPLLALVAGLASSEPGRADDPSAPGIAGAETEGGLSSVELDRMLARLGHDSADERRSAATAVAATGAEATAAIGRKLAELRRGADDGTFAVVKGVREHATATTFDLVEALALLKPDAGARHALTVACLLRALARAGTTAAVRQMVLASSDVAGAFRPELARQLKLLGDRAVPALVEARGDPSPETRAWASSLLEALGKRTPGDAVQTMDNQVVAGVLRAYAGLKDLDALPVVLAFVNSDHVQVRVAAREATLDYGQQGMWKLREAYAALTGEPAPEGTSAADLATRLFDAYDRYRLRDVYALVDQGLTAEREGRPRDAVLAFDAALARQPMLDRRAEMVDAYRRYAESLESSDRAGALDYLRKALRIDEGGPESRHLRGEIHYLEGEDLLSRGIADSEPFERALALDPRNTRARQELDRLHGESESNRARAWRLAAAGAVIALSLAGIVVFGGRPRT